ncbi:GDP-D-glucose phosphorylase 1 [Protopterus annectens]|uniref:GDP-D-glucose phosphorylase 1 n=1 Tax=Protopterus annectens TaxID=7888 RepID=UPI001CFB5101|nr:GDP-D-glucose phosphorylase 1 [Protopterus annectens]
MERTDYSNSKSEDELQEFMYSEKDFALDVVTWQLWSKYKSKTDTVGEPSHLSKFDLMLRSGWESKMKKGMFRYYLEDVETRILPGPMGYVAQLNVKRGTERRTPQDIKSICQSYDPNQFNFNKIKPGEVIFSMRKCNRGKNTWVSTGSPGNQTQMNGPNLEQNVQDRLEMSKTLVVINVSPLEFGNVLFVPDPALCLPQMLTRSVIRTGVEAVLLSAHPGFRVGFNSLGGFASVNNLHLHGYYLEHELSIETAPTSVFCPGINLLSHQHARGLVFCTGEQCVELDGLVEKVCRVTDFFIAKNIAHNMFITRGCPPGKDGCFVSSRKVIRVILWARKSSFGVKEESAFNVALCELAGHLPIKNLEDFNNITETKVIEIIQRYMIPEQEFLQLLSELAEVLKDS